MGEGGQRLALSPLQNDEDPTPRDGWEVSSRRWNSSSLLAARFPLGWFPAGPGGGRGQVVVGTLEFHIYIYRCVMSPRCYT